MARELNSTVRLAGLGPFSVQPLGTIIAVHEIPGMPDVTEYSVEWEDGKYSGEIWSEQDFDHSYDEVEGI